MTVEVKHRTLEGRYARIHIANYPAMRRVWQFDLRVVVQQLIHFVIVYFSMLTDLSVLVRQCEFSQQF